MLFVVGCTARHSATVDRRIRQFSWPSGYESCDTLWILSNLHRAADVSMGIERLADGCWKQDDDVDRLWWRRGTPMQISNQTVRQILDRAIFTDILGLAREFSPCGAADPRSIINESDANTVLPSSARGTRRSVFSALASRRTGARGP